MVGHIGDPVPAQLSVNCDFPSTPRPPSRTPELPPAETRRDDRFGGAEIILNG